MTTVGPTGLVHTCGLRAGGVLECWGADFEGQLGEGTPDQDLHPTPAEVQNRIERAARRGLRSHLRGPRQRLPLVLGA